MLQAVFCSSWLRRTLLSVVSRISNENIRRERTSMAPKTERGSENKYFVQVAGFGNRRLSLTPGSFLDDERGRGGGARYKVVMFAKNSRGSLRTPSSSARNSRKNDSNVNMSIVQVSFTWSTVRRHPTTTHVRVLKMTSYQTTSIS